MSQAHITFGVLFLMAVSFLAQRVPPYITALAGALALGALRVVPISALFSGFSNPTLVLFAGMFVVGDAIFRTGLANALGDWAVRKMGHGERPLLWGTMIASAVLSTVASNTATTAALIPLVLSVCLTAGLPASRLLMPMAFTSGYGGVSALIGTPPNMIVTEALRQEGLRPFGFFEFAWIGVPMALAGMLYMDLVGRRMLSPRAGEDSQPSSSALRGPSGQRPGEAPVPNVAAPRNVLRMWICGAILLAVVVVMALNLKSLPLEYVAVAGALFCVLTGCIGPKAAIDSIEWDTMILFGSMFTVAGAMEKSGASAMIGQGLLHVVTPGSSPYWVVGGVMLLNMFLGLFLSNTACAVLLAPIGITLAKSIGANPHAVLMAIAAASSCSFLSPVSTPPNLLVWEPGKYRFIDYIKVGSGLSLVCIAVTLVVIPWKWPVFPH